MSTQTATQEPGKALAIHQPQLLMPVKRSIFTMTDQELHRFDTLAKVVAASQLSYAKNGNAKLTEPDIKLIMLKGLEVGLEPLAALDFIDIIQGTPTLSPAGMLALINGHGVLEDMQVLEKSDSLSRIMMKRLGRSAITHEFSIEDARRVMTSEWQNGQKQVISLDQKSNWKQQPAVMLQWRNVSAMCRLVFGDILGGLRYTAEEIGGNVTYDDAGNTIYLEPDQVKTGTAAQNGEPEETGQTSGQGDKNGSGGESGTVDPLQALRDKSKALGNPDDSELARLAGLEAFTPEALKVKYKTVGEAWAAIEAAFKTPAVASKNEPEAWAWDIYLSDLYGVNSQTATRWLDDSKTGLSLAESDIEDIKVSLFEISVTKGYPLNIDGLRYVKPSKAEPYLIIDGLPAQVFVKGEDGKTARDMVRALEDDQLTAFVEQLKPNGPAQSLAEYCKANPGQEPIALSAILERTQNSKGKEIFVTMHPMFVNVGL